MHISSGIGHYFGFDDSLKQRTFSASPRRFFILMVHLSLSNDLIRTPVPNNLSPERKNACFWSAGDHTLLAFLSGYLSITVICYISD